jgi:hypothetical protein
MSLTSPLIDQAIALKKTLGSVSVPAMFPHRSATRFPAFFARACCSVLKKYRTPPTLLERPVTKAVVAIGPLVSQAMRARH